MRKPPPPWFDTSEDRNPDVAPKYDSRPDEILKLKAKIKRLQDVLADVEGAD